MKSIRLVLSIFLFAGTLGLGSAPLWAQGIISKVALESSNYCHIRYPAIREETLFWDRPVLQDARSSDIIDFYGPCDHDPLGKEEILTQRTQYRRELNEKANEE